MELPKRPSLKPPRPAPAPASPSPASNAPGSNAPASTPAESSPHQAPTVTFDKSGRFRVEGGPSGFAKIPYAQMVASQAPAPGGGVVGGWLKAVTASPPLGSVAFEALLDRITGSTRRQGNTARLLMDGAQSFPERLKLIENARSSVHMQTFIFSSDETGWQMANALAEKARQGVPVRLIYDAIGSISSDPKMFQMMKDAGVEIRSMSGEAPNQRWHEKHLIVDHEVSVEGGMNVGDNYAFGGSGRLIVKPDGTSVEPWRDVDVRLEGPSVIDTQRCFIKNWEYLGGRFSDEERERFAQGKHVPLPPAQTDGGAPSTVGVRVVQHRPFEDGDANTLALYAASIRAAQKSITIESAYFVPTAELKAALLDAASRGVTVRIMTNSETSSDMGVVTGAARFHYQELLAAGVEIYELQGTGTLHAKTATFDGVSSIVGSCNLNGRSEKFDAEVCLAISDEAVARQLEQRFAEGAQRAKRMDLPTARGDWRRSIKQWALARVSDLF